MEKKLRGLEEITKYFNYESRFNGILPRENLPRIKDGAYIINLDDKQSKRMHWVSLFLDRNITLYCGSFGIEYISQDMSKSKTKESFITYSEYNLKILLYADITVFIGYMIAAKAFLDYSNLFPPNDHNKNDKMIYK